MIRVPQFTSVTLGPALAGLPWDGSTGGVVAIDVSGNLDLNGGIVVATSLGFRGGSGQNLGGVGAPLPPNTNFRTLTTAAYNGNKGEGIAGTAEFVVNQLTGAQVDTGPDGYPNGSRARGAPGNAGGSGNAGDPNQNDSLSGGGGGANGGAGGQGGNTGDDGAIADADLPLGGHGGSAFASTPGRVVMGGAGGSGVKDSAGVGGNGGAGGGIVMIRANTVSGTGTLNASGGNGQAGNPAGGAARAGGGGGGGGTVVLMAFSGPLTGATATADGGVGGDGNATTATGPGGGGGGGVILLSGAATSMSVAGGAAGTTVGGSNRNATAGSAGTTSISVTQAQIPGKDSGAECGANQPPVAVDDTYTSNVGQTLNVAAPAGVLTNDSDPNGDPITATPIAGGATAQGGTVTLNANGSFTYDPPNPAFTGADTFTYTATDGIAPSNTATVTINVMANQPPVAVNDPSFTTNEDTPLSPAPPGVLANDTDPNGDTLTAILDSQSTNGTVTLNPNGSFTYTPNSNFNGIDTFTYLANDGSLNSTFATVTITVTAQPDAPVTVDDAYSGGQGVALTVAAPGVLANDSDADGTSPTAVPITAGPTAQGGTVDLLADGSFVYTPPAGFSGADTFTYQATDGALSSTATVTITLGFADELAAGYCGSSSVSARPGGSQTGYIALAVGGILLAAGAFRRRKCRIPAAVILLLLAPSAVLAQERASTVPPLPRALSLQEPASTAAKESQETPKPQEPVSPVPQEPQPGTPASDLIDFGKLEANFRVGFSAFSEDFESDPQFAAGILVRAPMPWFSRDVLGLSNDDFGAFLDLTVSQIDRDLDFLDDASGVTFFVGAGIDYTFHRDESWLAVAQLGLQYGFFGGVDDTDNGVALLAGLMGGYQVAEGFWVTLNPQVGFADGGDRIYFLQAGLDIRF